MNRTEGRHRYSLLYVPKLKIERGKKDEEKREERQAEAGENPLQLSSFLFRHEVKKQRKKRNLTLVSMLPSDIYYSTLHQNKTKKQEKPDRKISIDVKIT